MSDQTPPDPSGTPPQQPAWQPPAPQYGQPQPGQPQYGQPAYGQPQYGPPQGYYQPPAPTPGKATAALILGIAGLIVCPLVLSIPAWIIGRSAVKEIDASNGQLGGRSVANAGAIMGIVGTVLYTVLFILGVVLLATVGSIDCHGTSTDNSFSYHCN